MDVWHTGEIPSKQGNTKILCCMEERTGFLDRTPINYETSETVLQADFHNLFVPNRLPHLVIVDDCDTFKGVLKDLQKILSITCMTVAPDNHRSVRVDRLLLHF